MYDLYKDGNTNPVSLSSYKKIFFERFNLRFKTCKKDTCKFCDKMNMQIQQATNEDKEQLSAEHKDHLDNANRLREHMKADLLRAQTDPNVETITFDLQKTHALPMVPTNIVYYKRQLNLYNLGIHSGKTNKGIFNVWVEHEGGRGTQEIGSCLKKYINGLNAPVTTLNLYADSCGAQNRSIKLVLLLKSVQRLYTDVDYINVMKECRRTNKFTVNRISKSDFLSVAPLEACITNRKVDVTNNRSTGSKLMRLYLPKINHTI